MAPLVGDRGSQRAASWPKRGRPESDRMEYLYRRYGTREAAQVRHVLLVHVGRSQDRFGDLGAIVASAAGHEQSIHGLIDRFPHRVLVRF